jgi:hypothetical protein
MATGDPDHGLAENGCIVEGQEEDGDGHQERISPGLF